MKEASGNGFSLENDATFDPKEKGQLFYNNAIKHLEIIENTSLTHAFRDKEPGRQSNALLGKLTKHLTEFWRAPAEQTTKAPNPRLNEIKNLLEKAANYGNNDALLVLAEMNFFAKYTHPRNYTAAFDYYQRLASTGNATAQQMIGFMFSTGIGNVVERDQGKALLYHTFAAHGGDTAAEMTLGYRYLLGIGTEKRCDDAVYYYERVAEKVINHYLSGPPGGRSPPLSKIRLSDEEGGVYGYGASVMTDRYHRHGSGSDKSVSMDEILQYLQYLAQTKSDMEAQVKLGQLYYQGTRSIPRNFQNAFHYFRQVADKIPGRKIPEAFIKSKQGEWAGQAAGTLGRMYWRGEGVEPNVNEAHRWFEVGSELGNPVALNGLGMMYLDGIVVPKNRDKAIEYFKLAASRENADAQVNLAIEYVNQPTKLPMAIQLFRIAAEAKHLLAYWYLAQLNIQGTGLKASCPMAVAFYKSIAEHGDWLYPTVEIAYDAHMKGDRENALLYYMLSAERGYEVAQANVAYLLDTGRDLDVEESALIYWSRSANQNNVDSRVKMGDYYYRGIGTSVNYEKAAACYRIAAEIDFSPLAMWNLGWMYENGIGVSKDLHLAKRAYDSALNANPDAYLPVKLSLVKLKFKEYWEWLIGTRQYPREEDRTLLEDESSPLRNDKETQRRKELDGYDGDRRWDIGAEEELRQTYNNHLRQLKRDESENYGENGYDHDDLDGEYSEEDELIESLMILVLCILVGWLVYVRQFRFGGRTNNGNPGREHEGTGEQGRS
ncbi:ERAD-associated protein [Apophysomyces ossiformis]|uniref:ERAD-associated protein n=1 Tax=Apophysomyces ossiformis TaxID=679940 RepID=A0A8H7BZ14_9FUNG|nr:ERAD-associated protein [Apophysomyces ossiformis]